MSRFCKYTVIIIISLCVQACEIVPESEEAKHRKETDGWWDSYYGRSSDSSETCGFWGADCKANTKTNAHGW